MQEGHSEYSVCAARGLTAMKIDDFCGCTKNKNYCQRFINSAIPVYNY